METAPYQTPSPTVDSENSSEDHWCLPFKLNDPIFLRYPKQRQPTAGGQRDVRQVQDCWCVLGLEK